MASVLPQTQYHHIRVSNEDLISGKTSPQTIQAGVEEFHRNGVVILENVVHTAVLDQVKEKMLQDIKHTLSLPRVPYNQGYGPRNISQSPPLSIKFIHEQLWANRHAISIIENILGPKPQLCYVDSNIALPGATGRQAVHSDAYAAHPDCPFAVEFNVFLDDVSAENGSTELWLGTHNGYNQKDHVFSNRGWIKKESFCERAKESPPIQPTVPKGSILMRDLRLWHAGMPNKTETPRVMLVFIYFARWFQPQMRLTLPLAAVDMVQKWDHIDIMGVTDFVDENLDHISLRPLMNFTQGGSRSQSRWIPADPASVIVTPENYWTP